MAMFSKFRFRNYSGDTINATVRVRNGLGVEIDVDTQSILHGNFFDFFDGDNHANVRIIEVAIVDPAVSGHLATNDLEGFEAGGGAATAELSPGVHGSIHAIDSQSAAAYDLLD